MTSWRRLGLAEDGRATKDAVVSGFSRTHEAMDRVRLKPDAT